MPTARKSPSPKSKSSSKPKDAIALLTADHNEVKPLFKQYDKLVDSEAEADEKQALAEQICSLLTVHAQIEEEIFYPAAKASIKEADLVDEASVEHASAKDLIEQIQGMTPADELYDAKVKVLGEYIEHHVKEEESEMFPQAKKSDLDLKALGEELMARKHELMADLGMEQEKEEA